MLNNYNNIYFSVCKKNVIGYNSLKFRNKKAYLQKNKPICHSYNPYKIK